MVSLPEAFQDRRQNRLKLLQRFSELSALSLSWRLANVVDTGEAGYSLYISALTLMYLHA